MPRLTIAIPTFDRNQLLLRHVAELLPQMTSDVRLLILDNASPTPVAETLRDAIEKYPQADCQIVRHRVNIGSSANVMRCLELCATPWVWVLGDDDRPLPTAVATALAAIDQHNDYLLLSFNGMYRAVESPVHTTGLNDFIERIPNFANLTLISDNLLNASRIARHVRMGYFYAYSLYPYFACVLEALRNDGGQCAFLPEQLIEWGPNAEWSRVLAGKGFGVILDIPMEARQRQRVARMLNHVAGRYSTYAIHLLNQIGTTMDAATARHLFSQAWYRLYRFQPSPLKWLHRGAGYSMLCFPTLGRALYRQYRRWRSNPQPHVPADDMARC